MLALGVTSLFVVLVTVAAVSLVRHAWRSERRELLVDLTIAGALFAGAWWLRVGWLAPRHVMYVDEPWYLEAADTLLRTGTASLCERTSLVDAAAQCVVYPKAPGWPALLALAFLVTGTSQGAAFAISASLSSLAAPLAAGIARAAGGHRAHALLARVLLLVHPLHGAWSSTVETNAPATAPLLAGVLGLVLFLRAPRPAGALLATGGLGLAAWIRPDLVVVPGVALVACALAARRASREARLAAASLVLAGAAGVGSVVWTWALYESISGTEAFLSIGALAPNLVRIAADPLGGAGTAALGLGALAGAAMLARRGERLVAATLALATLFALLAIATYDARIFGERTVIGAVALAVPLAALVLPTGDERSARVAAWSGALALAVAAVLAARPGWERCSVAPGTQRLEARLPALVAAARSGLERDAVVLAEWPTVIALSEGPPALRASQFLELGQDAIDREVQARSIYLLADQFCERGFRGGAPSACGELLSHLGADPVRLIDEGDRHYGLVRLRVLGEDGPAARRFPREERPDGDRR